MNGDSQDWEGQEDLLGMVTPDLGFVDGEDLPIYRQLQQLGRLGVSNPQFHHQLRARLMQQAGALATNGRTPLVMKTTHGLQGDVHAETHVRSRSWSRRLRTKVGTVAAASLIAVSSVAVYQHSNSPAPVSAQVLLKHVVAALPSATADQVTHQIDITKDVGGLFSQSTVKRETWTQFDTSGAIVRQAENTITPSGVLEMRIVQDSKELHSYDAVYNIVTNRAVTAQDANSDPYSAVKLRQMVLAVQRGPAEYVRLLPAQTLDGAVVDVLKVTYPEKGAAQSHPYSLLYVDPHAYTIRGMDFISIDASGNAVLDSSMRVSLSETMPLSSTPAEAFAFTPPAAATVAVLAPYCTIPPVNQPISVAQSVAERAVPSLLLSGDAAGLKLQRISRYVVLETTTNGIKGTTVMYNYKAQNGATFNVNVNSDGPTGPAAAAAQSTPSAKTVTNRGADGQIITNTVRPLTLSIGGRTVDAVYNDTTSGTRTTRAIDYNNTNTGVKVDIFSENLSSAAFNAAVAALVDGSTQPAVATELQTELNAAPAVPAAPAPKPVCGSVG
ncbi:MAG: hypothetical protein JWO59_3280 [Chloroflexi bacterium]|nr:hypothetical protein [Chloroflexota bacterium]